jgi:hypothetical protein
MTTIVVTTEKCRVCGCTDLNPCLSPGGTGGPVTRCVWMDFDHTLCSNLRCIARVPLGELLEMPILRSA